MALCVMPLCVAGWLEQQFMQAQAGFGGEDPVSLGEPPLVQGEVVPFSPWDGAVAAGNGGYAPVLHQVPGDGGVVHDQFGARAVPDPGGLGRVGDVPARQDERLKLTACGQACEVRLEDRLRHLADAAKRTAAGWLDKAAQ